MHIPTSHSPLTGLLEQYLAGQIDEPLWRSVMVALDAREAGPAEREALVNFVHTAVTQRSGTPPVRNVVHIRAEPPAYGRLATP